MNTNSIRLIAITFVTTLLLAGPESVSRADDYKISGPFVHENLAVYFVHGASQAGPAPKTLREAAGANIIGVIETRKVNQLMVENNGDDELFLQAGEVVKGGDQDRVLGVSVILPPHSGPVPVLAFCIERGRWSGRPGENRDTLHAAGRSVPPREAKQFVSSATSAYSGALMVAASAARNSPADPSQTTNVPQAAPPPQTTPSEETLQRLLAQVSQAQALTWSEASRLQMQLSRRLRSSVDNPQSPTSLALTLDDKRLHEAEEGFVAALQSHGTGGNDVLGYVLVVDGRIDSAQIYSSNDLFRKMWPESLRAGADEAIAAEHSNNNAMPSLDDIKAFLASPKGGAAKTLTANAVQEIHDDPRKTVIETGRSTGAWIARTYHAKQ